VIRGVVAPHFRIRRADVVLDECASAERIDAPVRRDLEGSAHIAFDGDRSGTRVYVFETIERMQPAVRLRGAARATIPAPGSLESASPR
jgi:hypothetical protein